MLLAFTQAGSDKLKEALNKYFSAHSAGMNLARPFKAGERSMKYQRRGATREINGNSIVATRRDLLTM
jgi:hypothetical protein